MNTTRRLVKKITALHTVHVYRDTDWDEFVCIPLHRPQASYYTADKADALATAALMSADNGL